MWRLGGVYAMHMPHVQQCAFSVERHVRSVLAQPQGTAGAQLTQRSSFTTAATADWGLCPFSSCACLAFWASHLGSRTAVKSWHVCPLVFCAPSTKPTRVPVRARAGSPARVSKELHERQQDVTHSRDSVPSGHGCKQPDQRPQQHGSQGVYQPQNGAVRPPPSAGEASSRQAVAMQRHPARQPCRIELLRPISKWPHANIMLLYRLKAAVS